MSSYLCYAVGNEWRFSHHGPDTVDNGTYDREKITAFTWFDTTVCMVSCHESDGARIPDSVFIDTQKVHAVLGFSFWSRRYAYEPPYRWYSDSMRAGDTCIAAYRIRLSQDSTHYCDTVVFTGADTCVVSSRSYACLRFMFISGTMRTERLYARGLGLLREKTWKKDSLRLEIRLERARIDGVTRYVTWEQ
jgi:hypothetical protein